MTKLLNQIIDWEEGTMTFDDQVRFFQDLIDTGMAWTLQGCYGRAVMALVEAGYCHLKLPPKTERGGSYEPED